MSSSTHTPRSRRQPRQKTLANLTMSSHASPLVSFLHGAQMVKNQWPVTLGLIVATLLIRWTVSLGPYSGMDTPPMYGDFEAQRHWMEITTQLPITQWYWHDLEWWGLDYPPLTAYHSWAVGIIGRFIQPEWFHLHTSRGIESAGLKTFMRTSSLFSELVVYIPAIVIFCKVYGQLRGRTDSQASIGVSAILLQPGLMIIDHGHFQFNSLMFGFSFLALDCFITDHILWGSAFFVLSLCFKQMALYYSPVVFAYLLGLCVYPRIDVIRLTSIATVVIGTFSLMFGPLLLNGGIPQLLQCLHRVFPFARGLWEDKVANFWCATNIVVKFREVYAQSTLQRVSLFATLMSILPTCLITFKNPSKRALPLSLSACAWGFFLFSFQVHEKSVLLPLLPATLFLAGSSDPEDMAWISWMNSTAMFSMWPLLRRDGLAWQYSVLTVLYSWLLGTFSRLPSHPFAKLVHLGSYTAIIFLHGAEHFIGPVTRYPDIWVVGNVIVSFGAFVIAWGWTMGKLWIETTAHDKSKKE